MELLDTEEDADVVEEEEGRVVVLERKVAEDEAEAEEGLEVVEVMSWTAVVVEEVIEVVSEAAEAVDADSCERHCSATDWTRPAQGETSWDGHKTARAHQRVSILHLMHCCVIDSPRTMDCMLGATPGSAVTHSAHESSLALNEGEQAQSCSLLATVPSKQACRFSAAVSIARLGPDGSRNGRAALTFCWLRKG